MDGLYVLVTRRNGVKVPYNPPPRAETWRRLHESIVDLGSTLSAQNIRSLESLWKYAYVCDYIYLLQWMHVHTGAIRQLRATATVCAPWLAFRVNFAMVAQKYLTLYAFPISFCTWWSSIFYGMAFVWTAISITFSPWIHSLNPMSCRLAITIHERDSSLALPWGGFNRWSSSLSFRQCNCHHDHRHTCYR